MLRGYSQSSQCVTGISLRLAALMRLQYDAGWRAGAGTLPKVRVVITEIAWDGTIRRRALDTGRLTDPGRCESLLGQVLAVPRPTGRLPGARSMSCTPATAPPWWGEGITSSARCGSW